jgi:hypothetical protein
MVEPENVDISAYICVRVGREWSEVERDEMQNIKRQNWQDWQELDCEKSASDQS